MKTEIIRGFETAGATAAKRRRQMRKTASAVMWYAAVTVVAAILIFPFVMMVSRSFMSVNDINDARFFPSAFTFSNYSEIFIGRHYFGYLWNTCKILIFNIITTPISASLCAFAFGKLKWAGRDAVFGLVLATMMIPGTVIQVPVYVMYSFLGLTETAWPMMIPSVFGGGAVNIFLLRQFMRALPAEMDDAARIDGAGPLRVYFSIVMPLCSPIIIYVVVGVFSSVWNDFYGPLIYLTQPEKYTLAIAIYMDSLISINLDTSGLRMAAGVFMAIPPGLLFLLYQHKLVDGIMVGAVKG